MAHEISNYEVVIALKVLRAIHTKLTSLTDTPPDPVAEDIAKRSEFHHPDLDDLIDVVDAYVEDWNKRDYLSLPFRCPRFYPKGCD